MAGSVTENGDRVALMSGANRGIGFEIVRQLAERGFSTILGSRDEASGRAAAEGMNGNVLVRQLDVTDANTIDRLAASVEEELSLVSCHEDYRERGSLLAWSGSPSKKTGTLVGTRSFVAY